MALIRHKSTLVEVSVPDAEAALPYFPDYEAVPESSTEGNTQSSGEDSTAKATTQRSKS